MVPGSDQSQSALQDELDACEPYISMIFHRYIEKKRIKLYIANRESIAGFPYLYKRRELKPVNPFGYSGTGDPAYPLDLVVDAGDIHVPIRCHVWPKQGSGRAEREQNYALGGGSVRWQGLYFYRYDRLVQSGGWAGLATTEPHMSLARVEVDLPPGSDAQFRPTITKDSIQNISLITQALQTRPEFARYRSAAQKAYRAKPVQANAPKAAIGKKPNNLPVVEPFRGKLIISEWGKKELSPLQQDAALQLARGFLANRPRASLASNCMEVDRLIRRLLKISINE
jgi:hypothetical protein